MNFRIIKYFRSIVGKFALDEDRTLHSLDFGFLSSFFHEKLFFPKFELLNSGCGLSASAAYLQVFTVFEMLVFCDVNFPHWLVRVFNIQ